MIENAGPAAGPIERCTREWRNLADAPDLGSGGATHGGSSPPSRTSLVAEFGKGSVSVDEKTYLLDNRDGIVAAVFHLLGSKLWIWPILSATCSSGPVLPAVWKFRRFPSVRFLFPPGPFSLASPPVGPEKQGGGS